MRSLVILIFLLLPCTIFNSCQKKFEAPSEPVPDLTSSFKANINGVQFVAALYGAVIRNDSIISIAGKTVDGLTIEFTLSDSGVHVYSLDMNSSVNFCGYEDNNGLAFSTSEGLAPGDSGGTLEITSIDSTRRLMSGTFNLKVFRQLTRAQ